MIPRQRAVAKEDICLFLPHLVTLRTIRRWNFRGKFALWSHSRLFASGIAVPANGIIVQSRASELG